MRKKDKDFYKTQVLLKRYYDGKATAEEQQEVDEYIAILIGLCCPDLTPIEREIIANIEGYY